jgi:hypothetical protein
MLQKAALGPARTGFVLRGRFAAPQDKGVGMNAQNFRNRDTSAGSGLEWLNDARLQAKGTGRHTHERCARSASKMGQAMEEIFTSIIRHIMRFFVSATWAMQVAGN